MLFLGGCSTSEAPLKKRFFWPPPPAQPRIEYRDFFLTDHHVRYRNNPGWVTDVVLGKEKPRRLFNRPFDVASNGDGRVLVNDLEKRGVYVLDLERHEIRTLQSKKEEVYRFSQPSGLALNEAGEAFVADPLKQRIVVFDAKERFQRQFGGSKDFWHPVGLTYDDGRGRLYVADAKGHQVVVFDGQGKRLDKIGMRGEGPGEFNYPLDVDVDAEGNLYVLDSMNARVQVFDPDGNYLREFGERGTAPGSFRTAKALALDQEGHVYVTDSGAHRFVIFDVQGNYLLSVGGKADARQAGIVPGGFYLPEGIDIDEEGAIWVVDSLNRVLHRFQYLNKQYLEGNPILPGQAVKPERSGRD